MKTLLLGMSYASKKTSIAVYITDPTGMLVESAFPTGLIDKGSRVRRSAKDFEASVLKRFGRISSISDPMLARLTDKGRAPAQLFLLKNLAKFIPLISRSMICEELGSNTPYVALYSCSLAKKPQFVSLLRAARLLAHRRDLAFENYGDDTSKAELMRLAEGLNNTRLFPIKSLENFYAILGMATVFLRQLFKAADFVSPSKLVIMLAPCRQVIAAAEQPETALKRGTRAATW